MGDERRAARSRARQGGRIAAFSLVLGLAGGCGTANDVEVASERMVAIVDATVSDLDGAGMIGRLATRELRLPTACPGGFNTNLLRSSMHVRVMLPDGADQAELAEILLESWRDNDFEPGVPVEEEGNFLIDGSFREPGIEQLVAVLETHPDNAPLLWITSETVCSELPGGYAQAQAFTEDFYELVDADGDRFDHGVPSDHRRLHAP